MTLFIVVFLSRPWGLTAFKCGCSLASTTTRYRPTRRFPMLGSVTYHRIILIRIILEDCVDVWKTLLARAKVMVGPDRTENLNQHRTISIIVLDLDRSFKYQ